MIDDIKIDLLIFGAGGHAMVSQECATAYNHPMFLYKQGDIPPSCIRAMSEEMCSLEQWKTVCNQAFVAIGDNHIRAKVGERLKNAGFELVTLIHPHAIVSSTAEIADGVLVNAGAIVNAGAKLKTGCIVNSGAIVEHECTIGAYSHLSPGAKIGGKTHIGPQTWICIGATVIDGIHVGKESILAAGSVLLQDLPDQVMAAGIPAQIKHLIDKM